MKKSGYYLLSALIYIVLNASNGFADTGSSATKPPSVAPKNANQIASGNATSHRGANTAVIGGAAKNTGNISGTPVRLTH